MQSHPSAAPSQSEAREKAVQMSTTTRQDAASKARNFENAAGAPLVDPMKVVLEGTRRGTVHKMFLLHQRAWPREHVPSGPGRALLGASIGRHWARNRSLLMRLPCSRAASAATAATGQLLRVLLRHVAHQKACSLWPRFAPLAKVGDDLVNALAGAEAHHVWCSPHVGGVRVLQDPWPILHVREVCEGHGGGHRVVADLDLALCRFRSGSGCPSDALRCGWRKCDPAPQTSWSTGGPASGQCSAQSSGR